MNDPHQQDHTTETMITNRKTVREAAGGNNVGFMAQLIMRSATTWLLAAGLGAAGLGLAAGRAQADGPHRWCPGDPKNMPYVVNGLLDWDWNVCHTWYSANYGQGNVTMQGRPTSIWDGDNPPPDAVTPRQCPPISFMCP